MKKKKYGLYAFTILFFIVMCAGCGKKEESKNEKLDGGYNISSSVAGTLPEKALKAFKSATKDDDKYEPLACMGTQVVSGTNYMILAKEKDSLKVLVIYEDLKQKTSIMGTHDFNLLDYLNNNDISQKEDIVGGWNVPTEGNLNAMPQNLASAWSESFAKYKEIKLEPLACLGTQVVAGTNYVVLARGVAKGEKTSNLYVVVIYDDLDNNASITSVSYIDLARITNNK